MNSYAEESGIKKNDNRNANHQGADHEKENNTEPRYPRRTRFAPDQYAAIVLRKFIHSDDTPTITQAMQSPEK